MMTKHIKEHIEALKTASWDEVGETLMELESQLYYLKTHLTKAQTEEVLELIRIYEEKRAADLAEHSEGGFNRSVTMEQDISDVQFDLGMEESDF